VAVTAAGAGHAGDCEAALEPAPKMPCSRAATSPRRGQCMTAARRDDSRSTSTSHVAALIGSAHGVINSRSAVPTKYRV